MFLFGRKVLASLLPGTGSPRCRHSYNKNRLRFVSTKYPPRTQAKQASHAQETRAAATLSEATDHCLVLGGVPTRQAPCAMCSTSIPRTQQSLLQDTRLRTRELCPLFRSGVATLGPCTCIIFFARGQSSCTRLRFPVTLLSAHLGVFTSAWSPLLLSHCLFAAARWKAWCVSRMFKALSFVGR